jgi:hypothetical protein
MVYEFIKIGLIKSKDKEFVSGQDIPKDAIPEKQLKNLVDRGYIKKVGEFVKPKEDKKTGDK